jgi:hypothetical protein
MSALYRRPDWVRRINKFGLAVGDPALIVPLDPGEMLAKARASLGLRDVGDDEWIESYHRRLESIDRESRAHLLGRLLGRAETIRVLETQLRLRKHWDEVPAVLDEPIERPIFVVGTPRTGTSILLELLALDPQLRAPISWESHHPLPHGTGRSAEEDRTFRMSLAEAEQELWADIQPELMSLHELRSDLPCECTHFMALDFTAGYWSMLYETPGFDAWANQRPHLVTQGYRAHRRFLQTLQYGQARKTWLLKTPSHLATMTSLFAEYPDAIVVHTHRDPMKVVPSAASTTTMLRWLRSEEVDPIAQGLMAQHGFGFMLDQVRQQRVDGTIPDDQIVDTRYRDLIAEPAAAVRKIYDRVGLGWPDGHEDVIIGYLRDKPRGKFGSHEYDFATYGLDPDEVRKTYASYVDYYGVVEEE